ncbi:MAG: S8 family serine peptidase [Cyanobacteria bacterium J06598_1]
MTQNLFAPWKRLTEFCSKKYHVSGSLGADRFTVRRGQPFVVISGGGNVEYGRGRYDCLDLSDRTISTVKTWSSAECKGEIYNTGNGDRVFDALTFDDGSRILFEGLDIVEFADAVLVLTVNPNDPQFKSQWNLHMIGAHTAWRFTQGSSRVLIGVQDTGLGYCHARRTFHPGLRSGKLFCIKNNVKDNYHRNVKGDSGAMPDSHGTAVQSIISAATNDQKGISGINWASDTFHIDVLDANKGDLSLAEATWLMLQRARIQGQRLVVNLSAENFEPSNRFEQLIEQHEEEALFVFAAGNAGVRKLSHPASLARRYKNVLAVGAAWGSPDYKKEPVANLGDRFKWSNYGVGLSLMAPSCMPSACSTGKANAHTKFGWRKRFSGTSAATPHVSGAASLVWSVNPYLSAVEVRNILLKTAFDTGKKGYDQYTGYGFVDLDKAVRRAMAIALIESDFAAYEIPDNSAIGTQKHWKSKETITSQSLSLRLHEISLASSLCG